MNWDMDNREMSETGNSEASRIPVADPPYRDLNLRSSGEDKKISDFVLYEYNNFVYTAQYLLVR